MSKPPPRDDEGEGEDDKGPVVAGDARMEPLQNPVPPASAGGSASACELSYVLAGELAWLPPSTIVLKKLKAEWSWTKSLANATGHTGFAEVC